MVDAAAKGRLRALWEGQIPLAEAFWWYGIACGFMVNAAATVGAFAAAAAEAPGWAIVAVHLSPLPYNLAVLIGVWRSAARYAGPLRWASAARVAITIWIAAAIVL